MPEVSPDDLAAALTWARTKPREAAAEIRKRLPLYKGKDYYPPERKGTAVVTKEGTAAVQEAIEYLEKLEPLGPVGTASNLGLAVAAEDHVADIGFTGAVSHNSSDGTNGYQRVTRYGRMQSFGECLWYGSDLADAKCMVLDLIVDDGVESRGHRACICNPVFDTVGCAYGPHATYGKLSAMEFAKGWQPDEVAVEARVVSGPLKVSGQEAARKGVTTQWKSLGTCPVCKEPIRGGAVVEIEKLGGKLHKACFNCNECHKPLSGVPFNVHQQVPFCKECYFEKHGEKCTACGKAISGAMAKCALGIFHVECLICSTCGKKIGKNSFNTESGVINCNACASKDLLGGGSGSMFGSVAARGPPAKAKAAARAPSAPTSGRSSRPASGSGASAASPAGTGGASPAGARGASPAGARGASAVRAKAPGVGSPPRSPATGSRAASASALGSRGGAAGSSPGAAAAPAKAKAKAQSKSLSKAGAAVIGLGMDYGNL